MKPKSTLSLFLAGLGSSLLANSSAQAQLTWDANGTGAGQTNGAGAWLGTNLWWDGAANTDWVSGSAAIFGGTATAAGAVTLASPTTVESLTFNPSYTGTYTLGTAGQTITLNSGITKNASSGAAAIISPLTLGAAQTWTNNSTTSLSATGGLDNGGFLLTIDGTANTSFGGTANIITGAGGITKNGTGLLTFGAGGTTPAHNYSGPTVINGGNVMSHNNLSANSNYSLTDAMFADYYQNTTIFTGGLGTGAKGIQISGASGFGGGNGNSNWRIGAQNSTLTWGTFEENSNVDATGFFNPTTLKLRSPADNNGPSIWGQVTLQNRLDLNSGARTIDVLLGSGNIGNSRATIANGIQDTGATGSLTKTGGGMLSLGVNTSTWGGNTTISAGILDFLGTNMANIGGGSARNITVANGAGVRFNALSNAILNRFVETTNEIGVMTGTTGNSFDFSSSTGANLPNAFLGNWASNGAKAEISGTITPGSNGFKFGALGSSGLLGIRDTLTGANSLTIGQTGSSGIRVNIVAANTHTGETVINTGSRLTLGNNLALQNSALNVGATGGNFSCAAGTNSGKITGETAAPSPTFGGLIGSRNLITVFSNAASNNETNLARTAVTGFTLNVGTALTHTYSGTIGGFGADTTGTSPNFVGGNSTLTKTGEGTQILTGTHTYTGATTITGGTLDLGTTGSIAASTSLVLGAAGTLDTIAQSSYAIPASQPVEFGIDAAGSGSSGKITADILDISSATVTYNIAGPLDDAAYVLATYTAGNLTGTFLSVPAAPSGYELDYDFEGNKIALVSTGAPAGFSAWQSANSTAGGLDEDHDGDGVDNGTEFFLGGSSDTTGFTALPGVDNTGGTLSVTWTKATDYTGTYGTDFVVETSATLEAGSWTTEIVAPNPGATVIITGDHVTYTFPAGTKNFVRLTVRGPN
jgi:autotransporter-associated beta strand protein